MSGEQIYGLTVRLSKSQWDLAECRAGIAETAKRNMAMYLVSQGATLIGSVVEGEALFTRRVRVEHHEHGWQMDEQLCAEDLAEIVLLQFEQAYRV